LRGPTEEDAQHWTGKGCYPSAVSLSRRTVLATAALSVSRPALAMIYANLVYEKGVLLWPGGSARAACGKGGVRADKREGDHGSPAGAYPLVNALYRPDRLAAPQTALPIAALKPGDGWVDAPGDPRYNTLVALPYPASHETLWRDDGLYDLIVVIGYNAAPVVPGRGSAIFLHVASPNFSGTEGCIAVAREALTPLMRLLGPGSTITIKA